MSRPVTKESTLARHRRHKRADKKLVAARKRVGELNTMIYSLPVLK